MKKKKYWGEGLDNKMGHVFYYSGIFEKLLIILWSQSENKNLP